MDSLIGLLYLGLLAFAVWMWVDAINVPKDRWSAIPLGATGHWTKTRWFLNWYGGGLVSVGLIPMGMAIYYYRRMRPILRESMAPVAEQLQQLADLRQVDAPTANEFESQKAAVLTRRPMSVTAAFCAQCGQAHQDGDRFCRGCGAILSTPAPGLDSGSQYTPTPKRRPALFAVVAGVVAVVLAAAVGFIVVNRHANNGSSSTLTATPPVTVTAVWSQFVHAYNRKNAALRALPSFGSGTSMSELTMAYDQWANIYSEYQADMQAIVFPDGAQADADRVVRDLSALITDERLLAQDPASYTTSQSSVDSGKLDGDEKVLLHAPAWVLP